MTPTTYGRDFAYCLKSHGGVRGFNASLWQFLLRCTLFCHSVATFLTSVSSYEGGCGFEDEDKAFIDAFVNTDLLSSFMGGKESIEEYIVTRKNKIETLCEQTLSLYGDYMDENELNYVDGVLNSYFIQNPLTPMKFDIPKEVQPFYPNNQKEIGESIWQIFNIGKHMS